MNYELTIIQFPSGRFGYVGSVPTVLGTVVPATKSDVMGGRAYRDDDDKLVTVKFPTFETRDNAMSHAASLGFNPA